ncbi:MAG: zinc ribbon domain-containing protein [Clostridia bacterium]|nr:zinc ribbon domain-containing protein [Clostridia bacterium]
MALIKCPECGKEVSDKASACIHCGYPISNISNQNSKAVIKVANLGLLTLQSYKIDIINTVGQKLCTIVEGSTAVINIENDMEIYAQFAKPIITPCRSNILIISAKKSTRIQITAQKNFLGGVKKLIISEVDIIDSE